MLIVIALIVAAFVGFHNSAVVALILLGVVISALTAWANW